MKEKLTEEQIKNTCCDFVKDYVEIEKIVQKVVEKIELKYAKIQECIEKGKCSEKQNCVMDETEITCLRKDLNKGFRSYIKAVNIFLEETENSACTTESYYLELQKIHKSAVEYQKEVRKKISAYEEACWLYKLTFRAVGRPLDFMKIAEKSTQIRK